MNAMNAMNTGTLFGLITLVLINVFIGIVLWAWSARRRRGFERTARLPLEEDDNATPRGTKPS